MAIMSDDTTSLKEKLAAANLENAGLVSQKSILTTQNTLLRDQTQSLIRDKSIMRLDCEASDNVLGLVHTKLLKMSVNCDNMDVAHLDNNYEEMCRINWENIFLLKDVVAQIGIC